MTDAPGGQGERLPPGADRGLAPLERFLAHFHDRAPGGSPRAFGALPVRDGQGGTEPSSYHALVGAVASALTGPEAAALPPQAAVLDLACGDGHLLQLLHAALPHRWLLGADLSRGELRAAQTRLGEPTARGQGLFHGQGQGPGPHVGLLQARAQALPLAEASVAAITCHMALMLMRPAEAVLAELARVLRPGGWLLAVLPRPPADPAQAPAIYRAWHAATQGQAVDPRWDGVRFEGRRWRDPASLDPLLQQAGFGATRWQPLTGSVALDTAGAWDWIRGMYDIRLLGDADQDAALQPRFAAALAPMLDAGGRTTLPHTLWLLGAQRAPRASG